MAGSLAKKTGREKGPAKKRKSSRNKGLGKGNAENKDLSRENRALAQIGQNWLDRRNIVLAFEDLNINYAWDELEIIIMSEMSIRGESVENMVKFFNRSPIDVRVMLFSLALADELPKLPHDF